MSEWITDRLPNKEDCASARGTFYEDNVWTMVAGCVVVDHRHNIGKGIAWQPIVIVQPEPYVAPLRYTVVPSIFRDGEWVVEYDKMLISDKIPSREAAERIAAIYNEVMP